MSGVSGFNHKYNSDDVLVRSIIVSLINSLNEKIFIENTLSDTEKKKINVPFYYAFSGDERFLQDYFSNWSDCAPEFIEGNYDPIPRGSLTLTGLNVASNNMTSRFVRGYYVKEKNGELLRYNSYLNSVPLNLTFHIDVVVDTQLDSFKVIQELIKVFNKTLIFRVNFSGTVVPSQAGFPDSYSLNKLFEFTYGENSRITIGLDIEVESYYPIFDPEQEMFAGSRIEYPNISVSVGVTSSATTENNIINYDQPRIVDDGTFQINNQQFIKQTGLTSSTQKYGESYYE
jgi:hypothetical protein